MYVPGGGAALGAEVHAGRRADVVGQRCTTADRRSSEGAPTAAEIRAGAVERDGPAVRRGKIWSYTMLYQPPRLCGPDDEQIRRHRRGGVAAEGLVVMGRSLLGVPVRRSSGRQQVELVVDVVQRRGDDHLHPLQVEVIIGSADQVSHGRDEIAARSARACTGKSGVNFVEYGVAAARDALRDAGIAGPTRSSSR